MTPDHKDLSGMLEVAIVSARLAGQRAMEEINYIKASVKNDAELVTQADLRCQQIIIDRIKETFPDHGFIGEEGKDGSIFKQSPRGSSPFWWIIDPIDGTNNFARRILNFSVSIAVMYEGFPVVGVIYSPPDDSMFTAVKDGPAQFNNTVMRASRNAPGRFENLGVESFFPDGIPEWLDNLARQVRLRGMGSTALHLAYVGKGSMVAAIMDKPKLWDIAAGVLIAENAGATVTDWSGDKIFPVDLDSYAGESFRTLAGGEKTHPEILNALKLKC